MTAMHKEPALERTQYHAACHRRTLQNRRDGRVIYGLALAVCLLCLPIVRLVRIGRPGKTARRISILEQARTEAGIVVSYALTGY